MGLSLLFHQNEAAHQMERESADQMSLWRKSIQMLGDQRNRQTLDLRGGMNLYQSAVGDIGKGFDAALRAASLQGRGARRGAIEQGQRNAASTSQSMVSRGLYGTTAMDNAQRGVSSDTSRRLQEIDEGLAALVGQLEVGKGQALAGAKMGQASFGAQSSAMQMDTTQNLINLMRDRPTEFNKAMFRGQVGSQVSNEFASWFGGFFSGKAQPRPMSSYEASGGRYQ